MFAIIADNNNALRIFIGCLVIYKAFSYALSHLVLTTTSGITTPPSPHEEMGSNEAQRGFLVFPGSHS